VEANLGGMRHCLCCSCIVAFLFEWYGIGYCVVPDWIWQRLDLSQPDPPDTA